MTAALLLLTLLLACPRAAAATPQVTRAGQVPHAGPAAGEPRPPGGTGTAPAPAPGAAASPAGTGDDATRRTSDRTSSGDHSPAPASAARSPDSAPAASWRLVLDWLGDERDALADDLTAAHEQLVVRAEREDPALLERLSPEPPRPRRPGYGVLPELRADGPPRAVAPHERRYSIEVLTTAYTRDRLDAAVLARRAGGSPPQPLEPLVAELERLRERLRNLEEHLDYHAFWQAAVLDRRAYFDGRNRVVALVQEMEALRRQGGADDRVEELRQQIRRSIAPFTPTQGLRLRREADGRQVLPVTVHTDIDDAAFLEAFAEAVQAIWNEAAAARALRFALAVEWVRLQPSELHPTGPPAIGEPIDAEEHLARFPAGALVLTSGAESTHAWQGRAVLLGPSPVTRSTVAHEFGHLLGFSDGYLRGYAGDPDDRYGLVIVEWSGLVDDLMGNTRGGPVTAELLGQLLAAYSPD